MNRTYWVCALILIAASFAATAGFYPSLPERVPMHWNIRGEIDKWGPRSTVWIMPCAMVGMLGLFAILPKLSPRPFDLDSRSWTAYLFVMVVLIGLMGYLHALILWAAVSPRKIDVSRPLVAGVMLMKFRVPPAGLFGSEYRAFRKAVEFGLMRFVGIW